MTTSRFETPVKSAAAILRRLIMNCNEDEMCVFSIRRLSAQSGLTRRQILSVLDAFENEGLIERKMEKQRTHVSLGKLFQLVDDAKVCPVSISEDEKDRKWKNWCQLNDNRVPVKDVDAIEVKPENDADTVPEVPHIYSLNNSNKEYSNKAIDYSNPPTIEDVRQYAEQLGYDGFDAEHFWHHHNARQWKSGKNKIKNWRSAVVTWRINAKKMKPSSEIIDL